MKRGPVIGSVIGNYVVKEKVGEGGMGAVYLAEHPRLGRKVAIKLLHENLSRNPEMVGRFFVEAKSATDIGSDHIVGVLDFGDLPDGTSYLILEWLDGHSLGQALAAEKKLPLVRAIHIARGVARALSAAHAIGIVHRDLKPDNVFLVRKEDDPEFVKVLDFGIAKLLDENKTAGRVKTETGALIGTPAYMSPEQCRGADKVDQRTDIYALGVIFYEMVTGRLPFEANGLGDLLIAHMTETPPSLRSLEPSIPQAIDDAIMLALAKSPDERFQRIDAFVNALSEAWTSSGPIRTGVMPAAAGVHEARSPQSTLTRTAAEMLPVEDAPSSTRRPMGAIAGVAVAALLGAGVVAWRMKQHREQLMPVADKPAATVATPLPTTPTPTQPMPAPTPPTANPTSATTTDAAQVKLEVRVTPETAQLTLDGKPLANPFAGSLPRDTATHELTAKAPGWKTQTRTVTLDRDRAVELALVRDARPRPHATSESTPPPAQPRPATPVEPPGKPVYKGTKGNLITEFPEK